MEASYSLIWWVFALPIFGFLIQALTGKIIIDNFGTKLGRRIMGGMACLPIFAAFAIAIEITVRLAQQEPGNRSAVLTLFEWINLQSIAIPFEFRVDTLSMTMSLIITGIGALIHLYATGYMSEEKDYPRFFTYLNLFIACMLVLVLGNNLALLFIGWEGVGVCSYLLIGFWYKDVANSKAANKAFIVNRIGDYGLTLGMFLLVYLLAGSISPWAGGNDPRWLSYDVILEQNLAVFQNNPGITTAIALLLFVGAMGKSAQFPIYIWLPDAMAGPTPVSALIHAATMVTSGVFLLNRMSPIVDMSHTAMGVIAIVGAITALMGALIAFGQTDIKKVLAFSTVSQLGYMFIACGVGAYWAGLFHVTTHAFFKALLFLGSGAVIHAMAHNQDMRNYGNLMKFIKITAVTMIIGWAAIAGIPLLSGFFSKEAVLGAAVNSHSDLFGIPAGQIAGWVGFLVAGLTAAYMTRMTWLTFFSNEERWKLIPAHAHRHDHSHDHAHDHAHGHDDHGDHADPHGFFYTDEEMAAMEAREPHEHHHDLDESHVPHEVPPSMWIPLVVLAIASIIGGWLLNSVYPLKTWLYPQLANVEEPHGIPHFALILISLVAAGIGIGYAIMKYRKGLPENEGWDLSKWAPWRRSAMNQFGYDRLLSDGSIQLGGVIGRFLAWFDSTVIDGVVNGLAKIASGLGGLFRLGQTGYVRAYALLMQIGVVALLAYFIYQIFQRGGGQ